MKPLDPQRDSLIITTTTKEGIYFKDTAEVLVSPEILPTSLMMPSPEIIRTNNIVGALVSWVFSFKTNKNPVP